MDYLVATILVVLGVLLIGIVLLQRGRGGGLAGAFGGLGGQSAFGTKAGDTFTRVTIILAALWVAMAGVAGLVMRSAASTTRYTGGSATADKIPVGEEDESDETSIGSPDSTTDDDDDAKPDDSDVDGEKSESTETKNSDDANANDEKSDTDSNDTDEKTDTEKTDDSESEKPESNETPASESSDSESSDDK